MSTTTRILLATPNVAYEQRVRQAFGNELNGDLRQWRHEHLTTDPSSAGPELCRTDADVVVIGPDVPVQVSLELAAKLGEQRPEISVLIVAGHSPDLWREALRAGVRDVLTPEASVTELRQTIQRALQTVERRRTNLTGADSGHAGRIISVVSPKGGSGKTTVSVNLAAALAAEARGGVVIADLDLQFGDVSTALQLVPEYTVSNVVGSSNRLDAMAMKTFLTPHPSGLYALCAPDSPVEGELVPSDLVGRMVGFLADEFRYVVVDTSAGITEHTLAALEETTDIVLVCAMDVSSIRNIRKEILALDQLGMTTQRRHLVLNRADSRVGLEPADVVATVGMPIDLSLSSSKSVPESLNRGAPLVESHPDSAVSRQLRGFAERFLDRQPSESNQPGGGFFSWFKDNR